MVPVTIPVTNIILEKTINVCCSAAITPIQSAICCAKLKNNNKKTIRIIDKATDLV